MIDFDVRCTGVAILRSILGRTHRTVVKVYCWQECSTDLIRSVINSNNSKMSATTTAHITDELVYDGLHCDGANWVHSEARSLCTLCVCVFTRFTTLVYY
jgi:hypothetical protein